MKDNNYHSESSSNGKLNTIPNLPPLPSSRKRGSTVATASVTAAAAASVMLMKNEAKEYGSSSSNSSNSSKSYNGVSIPSLPVFKSKLSSLGDGTNNGSIAIENESNKENRVNFSSSNLSSSSPSLVCTTAAGNAIKAKNKCDDSTNDDICTNSNGTTSTLEGCDHSINNYSNSSTSLTSISASLPISSPSVSLPSRQSTRPNHQQQQKQPQQQRIFSSPSPAFTDSPSPPTTDTISPFPSTKPSSALASLAMRETPSVIRKHRLESRVLRSGETIESFFCLSSPQPTSKILATTEIGSAKDYNAIKSICSDIVHDTDGSKNDIHKWKQVLDYVYHIHNIDGNGHNVNDRNLEKNLFRLYKRATSRFGTSIPDEQCRRENGGNNHDHNYSIINGINSDKNDNEKDSEDKKYEKELVEIWLQYAKVQYKFCNTNKSNGTNSIYQLLQHKNLGQMCSIYYVTMADYELHLMEHNNISNGDNDVKQRDRKEERIEKARGIIEKGIKLGAKPTALLNNYLEKIEGLLVDNESDIARHDKNGEVCATQEKLEIERVGGRGAGIKNIGDMTARNEDGQERKEMVAASTSFSASSYRLRSKKRSPITSLSSRAKIRRNNSNLKGGSMASKLPRRILAINDDGEENTDDNENIASSDHEEDNALNNDSNDSIDDAVDSSVIKKHPKISFLEKEPEKITKDYISYLMTWDPMQRQHKKQAKTEDNKKAFECENQKSCQPMQKIEESMQENTTSNNGDGGNNTSSTSSGSVSTKDSNNSNNSDTHTTNTNATNNSANTGRNSNSSIQNNSVDTCLQNNVERDKRSGKKDSSKSTISTHALNDQSMNDVSQSFIAKQKISSSSSPSVQVAQAALNVDPDFLPLINKGRILAVNNMKYLKLGVIGKGGSCKVYRALASNSSHSIVAIKKVKLAGMAKKSIEGYVNEISLLRRLRHNPAIIQLYDSQVDIQRKVMYLVMEAGEVDLNHVLRDQKSSNGHQSSVNMNFIRLTWQQMLGAVHCIHEERIIHGDLKPANFLFVKGALKLIDFGIAKAIQCENTTNIYRESQVGTLNYMSPESIQDSGTSKHGLRMKCGRPSDVWSLGCILYEMCYGRPPFKDIDRMIPKLQAIINPSHEIDFPDTIELAAIDAMKLCLKRKPEDRAPIVGANGLLNEHSFLHSKR